MNHRDVQQLLDDLGVAIGAAEAHGCLCGALCASDNYGAAAWAAELSGVAEPVPDGGLATALGAIHQAARAALAARDPDFVPLLPNDAAALPERVRALAAWCDGFLYGLGATGAGPLPADDGDLSEILRDFAEVARAGLSPELTAEESEQAWAELFEFVRAGVQLTYEELAGWRGRALAAGSPGRH